VALSVIVPSPLSWYGGGLATYWASWPQKRLVPPGAVDLVGIVAATHLTGINDRIGDAELPASALAVAALPGSTSVFITGKWRFS
jgi:hypothetical protein